MASLIYKILECLTNYIIVSRCQYCRLQKCLIMGMRSDSPRVAAASEARRSSNASSKRISVDTELNGKIGVKSELYDSPTLLPRRAFIPESVQSREEDQVSNRSVSDSGSSLGDSNLLSQTMDNLLTRIRSMEESNTSSDTEDEINSVISDRPLLDEAHLKFDLTIPSPMHSTPTIHFVCETASRLLFRTLNWIKSIPSFSLLKLSLQIDLVRQSWASMFILGLAQISRQISVPSLLSLVVSHQQSRLAGDSSLNVKEVAETVCKIHEYVKSLSKLELDDSEFGYMKAVLLFGEGEITHHPNTPLSLEFIYRVS